MALFYFSDYLKAWHAAYWRAKRANKRWDMTALGPLLVCEDSARHEEMTKEDSEWIYRNTFTFHNKNEPFHTNK